MKHFLTSFFFLLFLTQNNAQTLYQKASLDDSGELVVTTLEVENPAAVEMRSGEIDPFLQFGGAAFPVTKNTRGVTLADLDGDGIEEVVFSINDTLYALKGDGGILFKKAVSGPILLPPTIVDMDGDGIPEIVLNHGYPRSGGGISLLDNEGNDMDGWPLSFDAHWMSNAPVVSDLDDDGIMEIITVEYVASKEGYVHVLKLDGTPYNEKWPIDIGAPPAFTPSVGDINGDGEKNIVIAGSSNGMHVFNLDGEYLDGFPAHTVGVNYSYQSPILVDLDGDGQLEIVGSNHGDNPAFYVMKADGTYMDGWPLPLDGWTYGPPTVTDIDRDKKYEIFIGVPDLSGDDIPLPVIYGLRPDGTNLDNFPIEKYGGNEGVISVADINNDGVMDVIFSSNITDEDGYGYIHAYSTDGSGEIEGFPLRPKGFTFLNGAVLGDIDNDGNLDLSVISYTLNFGATKDSVFLNVYNLEFPYVPENILRNGYKGSNTRDGLLQVEEGTSVQRIAHHTIKLFPNPSTGILNIEMEKPAGKIEVSAYDMNGRIVYGNQIDGIGELIRNDLSHLFNGLYLIQIEVGGEIAIFKWIKK